MSNLYNLKVFEDREKNSIIYIKKLSLEVDKYVVAEVIKFSNKSYLLKVLYINDSSTYIKKIKSEINISSNKYITLNRLYSYINEYDIDRIKVFNINDIADLSSRLSTYDINIMKHCNFISCDILKLRNVLDYLVLNDYKKIKYIKASNFSNLLSRNELNIEVLRLFQITYGYSVLNKIEYGFSSEGYKMFFHFKNKILEVLITESSDLKKRDLVEIVSLLNQLSISKDDIIKILNEKDGLLELYKF